MKLVVNVKNLFKIYKTGDVLVQALRGVDFQVTEGEFVAIMGPSGSGKSTLMHLLGCLDKPTKGVYEFNGQDIANHSDKELSFIRATNIGFVFQSYNLIQQLSVIENVSLPFVYSGKSFAKNKQKIIDSLKRVGLEKRLLHLPKQLSGGEMQRVAIARALVGAPSLILADEPTGNLDFENGKGILTLFQQLNSQGVTIILVTHDEAVAKHCKRIIRMRDGKILVDEKTC